jgi:hypothetical protein
MTYRKQRADDICIGHKILLGKSENCPGSRYDSVIGPSEHCSESASSIYGREFLVQLNGHQLLKEYLVS